MAIPFYIPEEEGKIVETLQSSIYNERIVQAYYEALFRCSNNFSYYTSFSPSSNHGHFSSVSSPRGSFRGEQRSRINSYCSQSQYSQFSEESVEVNNEDEDLITCEKYFQERKLHDEFTDPIQQQLKANIHLQKKCKTPKQRSNKITKFVITALQFIIDSLK